MRRRFEPSLAPDSTLAWALPFHAGVLRAGSAGGTPNASSAGIQIASAAHEPETLSSSYFGSLPVDSYGPEPPSSPAMRGLSQRRRIHLRLGSAGSGREDSESDPRDEVSDVCCSRLRLHSTSPKFLPHPPCPAQDEDLLRLPLSPQDKPSRVCSVASAQREMVGTGSGRVCSMRCLAWLRCGADYCGLACGEHARARARSQLAALLPARQPGRGHCFHDTAQP